MGLLEKAGNTQTEDKKTTTVVKPEKKVAKIKQAAAKSVKVDSPTPKESKKAAKAKKAPAPER